MGGEAYWTDSELWAVCPRRCFHQGISGVSQAEWLYKVGYIYWIWDGFYEIFINALVQYYEAVNEKNIFKMSSDFIKLLEKKEKEKIEYLEKDFNRFFNGTLLEDVYEWN